MELETKIATGKATCQVCNKLIPRDQPCLEVRFRGRRFEHKEKICKPCLDEKWTEMDAVIYAEEITKSGVSE